MTKDTKSSNGANLGYEQKLWQAADKLRSNMDAAEVCEGDRLSVILH